jgi:HEPN domain-containing protein
MDTWLAEWIAKAEADYRTMEREAAVLVEPSPESVCFHAQQCAEKYLKARVVAAGTEPSRTHSLLQLLSEAEAHESMWTAFAADLAFLATFAVRVRYPGEAPTDEDAAEAVAACRRFRAAARTALGL